MSNIEEKVEHICNDDGSVFETKDGKRHFFASRELAQSWYEINYEQVVMGSVACNICKEAFIDKCLSEELKNLF